MKAKFEKFIHLFILLTAVILAACSNKKYDQKGFQVVSTSDDSASKDDESNEGFNRDSSGIHTRPSSVLLCGISNVRLTTIYKVNVNKKDNSTFIGSNNFYYRYEPNEITNGNNWNNNLMPGLEAVYGYNMVNISHYDIKLNKQKLFFENPVLVKTLYYPSFSKDTLNGMPLRRGYFMVSVYNSDTNKDGYINLNDLRRFYLFDASGVRKEPLIPENYSVFKSEYDSENDFLFVFAQLDINYNGQQDEGEPVHVFWIDLKDPTRKGRQY